MHAADDVHAGEAGVGELTTGERAGDHADDLAAGGKHGVGQRAHEPDRAAAVDHTEAAADEGLA